MVNTAVNLCQQNPAFRENQFSLTTGDDEVEKPLGSGSQGHVESTETCRRDLADNNPARRAPTELEEAMKEVREEFEVAHLAHTYAA